MEIPEIKIAPSLLSADFARLADDVRAVEQGGADWLHVDVMDGHFVPNISIGIPVVSSLKKIATCPLDVHIMISEPARYAEKFVEAGADIVTCHVETEPEAVEVIRSVGAKAGLAINPETEVEAVKDYLDLIDMLLVMSVRPGFGGQAFMGEVLPKIEAVRNWGYTGDIEIDGGISPETIEVAASAGANVFVAGSAIFGSQDWQGTMKEMRAKASACRAALV